MRYYYCFDDFGLGLTTQSKCTLLPRLGLTNHTTLSQHLIPLPALFCLQLSDEWWRQLRLKQSTKSDEKEVIESEIKATGGLVSKETVSAASMRDITR